MKEENIPDLNIFMMCEKLNEAALKDFPFDTNEDKETYKKYMTKYFNDVYAGYEELFYNSCLFICDKNDKPVATCFAWKAYDNFYTIHWLKVLKEYEGKGLGRAILSEVMKNIPKEEYPIYLHTQPSSFRAIKLYSDFGFSILTDEYIGNRKNDYKESLTYLEYFMGDKFKEIKFLESDKTFSLIASKSSVNQF